jgi:hypothetical protein
MPVMKRLATLLCISIAVCAPASSVLRASDDPPFTALASSSYYGRGGFDEANDMVVDAEGFVYLAGWTESFGARGYDGFVAKLSPDGSEVLYSTLLGGSGFDIAEGLALDPAGGVYVVGHTTSTDFPLIDAFQTERRGSSDVWIAKLDTAGTLAYSTYYGGSSFENGMAIALGPTGAIYVTGSTGSLDLPAATGFQQANAGGFADGFVLKINPDGSGPAYATYLGGSGDEFVSGSRLTRPIVHTSPEGQARSTFRSRQRFSQATAAGTTTPSLPSCPPTAQRLSCPRISAGSIGTAPSASLSTRRTPSI